MQIKSIRGCYLTVNKPNLPAAHSIKVVQPRTDFFNHKGFVFNDFAYTGHTVGWAAGRASGL